MLGPARVAPKSWSSTLSLPRSAFPPRAIPADRPKYLKRCTDELYARQRGLTGDTFTLHDGPPYANGSLHIGHALNKILKDILCRFKLSQGYRIDYVPGWDCHGLPIELKAIEQHESLGQDSNSASKAVDVRSAARRLAEEAVEKQKRSFQQWVIMADWDHAWKTMDKGFEIRQLAVFKELVKKGLIYRRFKPVYWSPSTRTALAEAELEYKDDHVSTAAFVKYPVRKLPNLAGCLEENALSALVWTTTPWTLPANKAIAFHSELDYAIVRSERHGNLLLARTRIEEIEKVCTETFSLVSIVRGSELQGAAYNDAAFTQETRPFLHADFVSADSGSGLVHLAPGHGMDDYQLCLKHNIPAFAPLDDEGRFTNLASLFDPKLLGGKEVLYNGNHSVLDFLTSKGLLLTSHKYKHKYPYDWRSKRPVIVRATEQWFADVGGIQDDALRSLDSVAFIPEGGKERLRSFVKNRTEWCISRQRSWGVPIPALYDKETGEAVLTEASIDHILTVIEDRGLDAWWTDDASDPAWVLPSLIITDESQRKTSFIRGKDTMDVWFDSGTSWTQLKGSVNTPNQPLADVYLEGSDQHRGWFQSSLLTYIAQMQPSGNCTTPQAPFRTLITHGFALDEHSRKMSKSIGNTISPDEIMDGTLLPPLKRKAKPEKGFVSPTKQITHDAMGPDALRLWVASCDFTNDVTISPTIIKAIHGTLSKYRVTFKLLLGMLDDFDPQATIKSFEHLGTVHQIALTQLSQAIEKVLFHYEQFDFKRAVQEINRYINTDLSSSFIESIKDTIYADSSSARSRVEAQSVLLQIYSALQAVLYPITPLLIEEVLDYAPTLLNNPPSSPVVSKEVLADIISRSKLQDGDLEKDLPWLLRANSAVKTAQEEARAAKKMGSSLQSEVLFQLSEAPTTSNRDAFESLTKYQSSLETILVVSGVKVSRGALPAAVESADWSYQAGFDLLGSKVVAHIYTPQKLKCIRCWKYHADIKDGTKDILCKRCEEVIEEIVKRRPDLFNTLPLSDAGIPP
ncbi:MAG: hypothetical protein Q9195_003036 [Heterodermia aff. obscurata]